MKTEYLIRLDDACPTMGSNKWRRMESLLDKYGIKPMVGVIPHNEDTSQMIDPADNKFWEKVHRWEDKGWTIAMHGYNHCYNCDGGMRGINPMWNRSEFAGLSIEEQRDKIFKGVSIMREQGFNPKFFFAPSHTFDDNTLKALLSESDIRIVSDTIGRYPYSHNNFWFIPQITGHCVKMPLSGIYTFCFHPNMMEVHDFMCLETFLNDYSACFISFDEINLEAYGKKLFVDKLLSFLFFKYRKIKGLR